MSNIIDRRPDSRGKSSPNRDRFIKRIKGHIKKAIPDIVDERSIKDFGKGGKTIPVPIKGVKEPRLRYDPRKGKRHRILPGNDQFMPGDRIKKPQGSGQGAGQGAGGGDSEVGEDDFVVHISQEEFMEVFFDDLELPNMARKLLRPSTEEFKLTFAGQIKSGIPPRLNIIKSFKNSIGRRLGMKTSLEKTIKKLEEELKETEDKEKRDRLEKLEKTKIPYLDDVDLRYDHYELEPVPITSAVMFCVMDVSGSMGFDEKDYAKRFFMLLYLLLKKKYKHVDVIYVRHHHEAKEVTEEEFFTERETGGTIVSPALELVHKIRRERYPLHQWNVYCAQASDGDNFAQDQGKVASFLMGTLLKEVQYYTYIQVGQHVNNLFFGKNLWTELKRVASTFPKVFQMKYIKEKSEIFEVFRELFKKKGENNAKAS
jgi:uncharacterized protein